MRPLEVIPLTEILAISIDAENDLFCSLVRTRSKARPSDEASGQWAPLAKLVTDRHTEGLTEGHSRAASKNHGPTNVKFVRKKFCRN